jgi:hypothetical protein
MISSDPKTLYKLGQVAALTPATIAWTEYTMNAVAPLAVSALLLGLCFDSGVKAADPSPPKVCLNVHDIQRTETPDDRTIVFHMRDGKVWRNTLRTACPMLRTSPYIQKLNGDLVCSNQQFIHLTLTGDDCALGDFSPAPAQR